MKSAVPMVIALALALPGQARAYQREMHIKLSKAATLRSVLATDPDLLTDLGMPADVAPTVDAVAKLIWEGAVDEDSLSPLLRVTHHFYDPVYVRALHPCIAICLPPLCGVTPPICHQSPTWALEDTEEIGSQKESLRDARGAMRSALTETDADERRSAWERAFRRLGHVIHHLEDMAQPQHVRNDIHIFEAYWEARARPVSELSRIIYQGGENSTCFSCTCPNGYPLTLCASVPDALKK